MYIFMAPGNSFKNFFLNDCLLNLCVPKKKKKKLHSQRKRNISIDGKWKAAVFEFSVTLFYLLYQILIIKTHRQVHRFSNDLNDE